MAPSELDWLQKKLAEIEILKNRILDLEDEISHMSVKHDLQIEEMLKAYGLDMANKDEIISYLLEQKSAYDQAENPSTN